MLYILSDRVQNFLCALKLLHNTMLMLIQYQSLISVWGLLPM